MINEITEEKHEYKKKKELLDLREKCLNHYAPTLKREI